MKGIAIKTEKIMKIVAFVASVFASYASFAATPIDGWYSTLFGGYTYVPGNVDKTRNNLTRNHAVYESGFEGGGSFGFKSNPMRYEGELTYLKANTRRFNLNDITQTDVNGYNQALFALANIYYDFPGIVASSLQPYLGVGIGYGWIQTRLNSQAPSLTRFTAQNATFAYQGTAGVTFNFAENYALNLGYRYIGTANSSQFGEYVQVHIATVGATYRFDGCNYK